MSPKLGFLLSAVLFGVISGTLTFILEVLLPTAKELVTLPYPTTVATTFNVLVLPAAKSTIQVTVLVFSSQTPPSEELTYLRPLPNWSTMTT